MLEKLSVRNFAIIEDIDISFHDGLTILTGETGAGKSLIIDSISLLLGERASLEMIRNGEDKAVITGVFSYKNVFLKSFLDNLNIDTLSNRLEIVRTISSTKSSIKANGTNISLNDLKVISKYLADIHLQFDMTKLLNKDNYLDIIDGFKRELIDEYLEKYHTQLNELKRLKIEYDQLVKRIEEIKLNQEQYEYDLKEISSLNLVEGEEESIKEQISLLKNYDKIFSLLKESEELIDKESLEDIYSIKENVKELSNYQSEYQELYDRLSNSYYEIEDIYDSLRKKTRHLDYNPNLLDELEARSNTINSLKKKHGKTLSELIKYQAELETLLSHQEDYQVLLDERKADLQAQFNVTYQSALDISNIRNGIAKNIKKEFECHLSDLGLKSSFEARINTREKKYIDLSIFLDTGIDEIDFCIETNIGEGLKPLAKIVSGGEASRIMLAFKTLFIKSSKIETVIFDEIDTGISGEVASKVAKKIHEISLTTQVISITHLPQVASLSKNHIKISKQVKNGRTFTYIKELNLDEKIYEIAALISGGKVTDKQLEYAKEMVLEKNG